MCWRKLTLLETKFYEGFSPYASPQISTVYFWSCSGLWSSVPTRSCSFPFVFNGFKYCGCRHAVMLPQDPVCRKSYYSCPQLTTEKPAFCNGLSLKSKIKIISFAVFIKFGYSSEKITACNFYSVNLMFTLHTHFIHFETQKHNYCFSPS